MAKNLMVVESPAKAKTLRECLGRTFKICSTGGPILALPKNRLGVDIANDFRAEYRVIAGKKPVIDELRRAAGDKAIVYLACDPDREGEEIAWHIAGLLGVPRERLRRVLFHEITQAAVKEEIAHPQGLNPARHDAQQTRRILDRLIGSQISQSFWHRSHRPTRMQREHQHGAGGLGQSVALRLLVERERTLRAGEVGATRRPLPPAFDSSRLLSEAARKLSWGAARTMEIAQRLYECGLITFPRAAAIRPTSVDYTPETAARLFAREESSVYALVWSQGVGGEPLPAQHFTVATLIEELKDKGVGRPATYASIVGGLLTSGYVTEDESRRLQPSELGMLVTDLLVEAFPDSLTVEFAAGVETTLDAVEDGREGWVDATRRLYSPFAGGLAPVATRLREAKTKVVPSPVAKYTIERACPNCGRPMQTRFGRYGRFAACTSYPECKTVQPFALPELIGVRCPDCAQGDVVGKFSHRRKLFYACSRYPDCTFSAKDRPRSII